MIQVYLFNILIHPLYLLKSVYDFYPDMPGLVSLNLDGTGVTESGFIGIIPSLPASLQVLNLNRTNVTEKLLTHLKGLLL